MVYGMGPGILSGPVDEFGGRGGPPRKFEATIGLLATHLGSGFSGTVVRIDAGGVVLRAKGRGTERHFPLRSGDFLVAGETVTLVARNAQPGKSRSEERRVGKEGRS